MNNINKRIKEAIKITEPLNQGILTLLTKIDELERQLELSEQKRLKAIEYIINYQEYYKDHLTTDLDEWQMEEKVKEILGEDNE